MGTRGAEIFANLSHRANYPVIRRLANHISNRISKAAQNAKATAESEWPEAVEEYQNLSIGSEADRHDVLPDEPANPLIRMITTAYQSDFFPVLLLLAIYTLFAFGAALIVLLGLIAHIG